MNTSAIINKGYDSFIGQINEFDCPDMDILIDHWPHYDQLKTIVIGSSPAKYFISSGAFVGQPDRRQEPPKSVQNLIKALGAAFGVHKGIELDLEAKHSKLDHGIMFINVCLCTKYTDYIYEVKDRKVERVIAFINRVLAMKMRQNQRIGVLDLRLDEHCHKSEYQGSRWPRKSSTTFKIQYGSAHNIFRLGHPTDFNVFNWYRAIEKLRIMSRWHPEITSIYLDRSQCPCSW